MKKNRVRNIGPILGLFLFCGSLWILHQQLETYSTPEILKDFRTIPKINILLAFALTLIHFLILTLCELLTFRYIQKPMKYKKIVLTSFIAYSFARSAGFSGFSAGSIRYRFYSGWGLPAFDIAKIIAYVNVTFILGLLTLAGIAFTFGPLPFPAALHLPFTSSRPLGFLFLLVVGVYFIWIYSRKKGIKIRDWEVSLPSFKLSASQVAMAAVDIVTAATTLFVLLPNGSISYPVFITIYLMAATVGISSQVPGGLGVFESVILLTLSSSIPRLSVAGALVAYRIIYFLIPLAVASALLGWNEFQHQKKSRKSKSLKILKPEGLA